MKVSDTIPLFYLHRLLDVGSFVFSLVPLRNKLIGRKQTGTAIELERIRNTH